MQDSLQHLKEVILGQIKERATFHGGHSINRTHYFYLFIYLNFNLFLAALLCVGLRCCAWAFSSCGERGLLLIGVCRLLTAVASLVEQGPSARGLQ